MPYLRFLLFVSFFVEGRRKGEDDTLNNAEVASNKYKCSLYFLTTLNAHTSGQGEKKKCTRELMKLRNLRTFRQIWIFLDFLDIYGTFNSTEKNVIFSATSSILNIGENNVDAFD